MIKAHLCVCVKRVLLAAYSLDFSCRNLRTPLAVVLGRSPILVDTALLCLQLRKVYIEIDLRCRHELDGLALVSEVTGQARSESTFSTPYRTPPAPILKPLTRGPIKT